MRTEEKTHVKNSIGRLVFVALSVLFQLSWLLILIVRLNKYSEVINLITMVLTVVVVLRIYGKQGNVAFKMPWVILILALPVLGLCLYLMFGHKEATGRMRRRFEQIDPKLVSEIRQDPEVMKALEERDFGVANQCRYIQRYSKYPVYGNTDAVFYAEAKDGFEAQLEELKKAESFIFMEYHAIQE